MNPVEEQLLRDHHQWFDQLPAGFVCMACLMPRKKTQLGKISIFRPAKRYKLARTASCIICDECEKLPAAELYVGLEKYLLERGHLEL
jgi:hypothetical protein